MKSPRPIDSLELRALHRANGGFHDAELARIEWDEVKMSLCMLLVDLRRFVGEKRLPEPSASAIELVFESVVLNGKLSPELLVEYGVNQFSIMEGRGVYIETALGSLEFTFSTVSATVIGGSKAP